MSNSTTTYYESAGKVEQPEYRESPKQDKKLERAKRTVKAFLEESEKYTKPYFKKFRKIFADYMMSRAAMYFPAETSHGVQSHLAFNIIESFTPEIVLAFFQEKPYCNAIARNPFLLPVERQVEDFLGFQADEIDIISKMTVAAKSKLMYGTAIVKTPWVYDTKTGDDRPDWDNVSIFNFFPDPHYKLAGDIQGMKGCVHRIYRTWDQIKLQEKKKDKQTGEMRGIYTNLDKLKARIADQGRNNEDRSYYDKGQLIEDPHKQESFGATQTNGIQLDEYWGIFESDYDKDGEPIYSEYIITLADNEVVIRCEENRLDKKVKPFLADPDYIVPGEWYGAGEIEPVWSTLVESKILKQAKLTAVKLATNPITIVDRNGGFNTKNLQSYPGALWVGNNIDGIKPLSVADGFLAAYREIASMEGEIQQSLALPTPGAGVIPGGSQIGRTQAGVQFIQQSTNKRILLKIMLSSCHLVKKFFLRMVDLNGQFLSDEVIFRVQNKENPFKVVRREFFKSSWAFSMQVAIDRMTKNTRIANLKENVVPLLELQEKASPGEFNWRNFIQASLKDVEYSNAESFYRSEEEVAAMKQQQMEQQQALAERNIQAQTQAQAALGQQRGEIELQKRQMMDESTLKKTAIKGMLDSEKTKQASDNAITKEVITSIVKKVVEEISGNNGE